MNEHNIYLNLFFWNHFSDVRFKSSLVERFLTEIIVIISAVQMLCGMTWLKWIVLMIWRLLLAGRLHRMIPKFDLELTVGTPYLTLKRKLWGVNCIQSSAVITRSNIVSYCINNCSNSGRISIKCLIHKRHPIPRPNGRVMGCHLWTFFRKFTAL